LRECYQVRVTAFKANPDLRADLNYVLLAVSCELGCIDPSHCDPISGVRGCQVV